MQPSFIQWQINHLDKQYILWNSLYFPELGSFRGTICKFFLVNRYLQMHIDGGANKKNYAGIDCLHLLYQQQTFLTS